MGQPAQLVLAILGWAGLWLAPAATAARAAAAPARELTIISSGSIRGETKVCGCKVDPKGGLARRMAYYRQVQKDHAVSITVDAGDFALPKGNPNGEPTTDFMARSLKRLGYDAWTPGELELSYGIDVVRRLAAAMEAPAVSANITDLTGNLLFPDRASLTVGGIRVGITGVTSGNFLEADADSSAALRNFKFGDPKKALSKVVAELRKTSDVVVVLAHLRAADIEALARGLSGVDVFITGHFPKFLFDPDPIGGSLLVQGGNLGHYGAQLTLQLDPAGAVIGHQARVDALGQAMPADPSMAQQVAEFDAGLKKNSTNPAPPAAGRSPGRRTPR